MRALLRIQLCVECFFADEECEKSSECCGDLKCRKSKCTSGAALRQHFDNSHEHMSCAFCGHACLNHAHVHCKHFSLEICKSAISARGASHAECGATQDSCSSDKDCCEGLECGGGGKCENRTRSHHSDFVVASACGCVCECIIGSQVPSRPHARCLTNACCLSGPA
jgi:hypothetical protein